MKYLLIVSLFFFGVQSAWAYDLHVTELAKPYDLTTVNLNESKNQVHLGELKDFPIMYEFSIDETETINLSLRQIYKGNEPVLLTLLMVRVEDNGRGVREIVRYSPQPAEWLKVKDPKLGLSFFDSEMVSKSLDAGTYRVEVSTPTNEAKFALVFGEADSSAGYFESIKQTMTTQKFFDYSFFKILTSSLIYYPLGIIFVLFALRQIFKYRKIIKNAD